MFPTRRKAGIAALVLIAAAAAGAGSYVSGSAAGHGYGSQAVCGAPAPGDARCNSRLLTRDGQVVTNTTPAGYGPSDLQSAYNLTSASTTNGTGQTVAIVDAYDDPNAVNDVSAYRSRLDGFGCKSGTVSVSGCTFSNGPTIKKVGQSGTTSYPRSNGGWAQEISLDLDMVSAICPNCSILLVEANSASMTDLGASVKTAVNQHANVISNSYGGNESSSDSTYDSNYFNQSGVVITASSGDSGYGVEYPAASKYVVSAGGTSLTRTSSGGWSESAWSGAGSGCSADDSAPAWQATWATKCSNKAVADVSADADPNTGVAVYDSFRYQGLSGWLVFGGTSVASPIIASVYALAGNAATNPQGNLNTGTLNDITSGSNGNCPSATSLWCTAGTGWDGPTGLGSPNGTGAF